MVAIVRFKNQHHLELDFAENWSAPERLRKEINKCFIRSICLWVFEPFLNLGITTEYNIGGHVAA